MVPSSDIYVVTADRDVAAMAEDAGIATLAESTAGLNEALAGAIQQLARLRQDFSRRAILVLPTDLPRATPMALRAAIEKVADILLVPDHSEQGTNLLRLGPGIAQDFQFHFGPGSFTLHQAEASRLSITSHILREAGLSHDVDTPEDYASWQDNAKPHQARI